MSREVDRKRDRRNYMRARRALERSEKNVEKNTSFLSGDNMSDDLEDFESEAEAYSDVANHLLAQDMNKFPDGKNGTPDFSCQYHPSSMCPGAEEIRKSIEKKLHGYHRYNKLRLQRIENILEDVLKAQQELKSILNRKPGCKPEPEPTEERHPKVKKPAALDALMPNQWPLKTLDQLLEFESSLADPEVEQKIKRVMEDIATVMKGIVPRSRHFLRKLATGDVWRQLSYKGYRERPGFIKVLTRTNRLLKIALCEGVLELEEEYNQAMRKYFAHLSGNGKPKPSKKKSVEEAVNGQAPGGQSAFEQEAINRELAAREADLRRILSESGNAAAAYSMDDSNTMSSSQVSVKMEEQSDDDTSNPTMLNNMAQNLYVKEEPEEQPTEHVINNPVANPMLNPLNMDGYISLQSSSEIDTASETESTTWEPLASSAPSPEDAIKCRRFPIRAGAVDRMHKFIEQLIGDDNVEDECDFEDDIDADDDYEMTNFAPYDDDNNRDSDNNGLELSRQSGGNTIQASMSEEANCDKQTNFGGANSEALTMPPRSSCIDSMTVKRTKRKITCPSSASRSTRGTRSIVSLSAKRRTTNKMAYKVQSHSFMSSKATNSLRPRAMTFIPTKFVTSMSPKVTPTTAKSQQKNTTMLRLEDYLNSS